MNWIFITVAVSVCMYNVIATTRNNNSDTPGGPRYEDAESTGSADVRCDTIDDVAAVRRALCPAECRCSPTQGQDVLTRLTVDCSGVVFNESAAARLNQDIDELLSRCVSNLTQLTVSNTPLTALPDALCRLTEIRSLNLGGNRLESLPGNCFTRMRRLTSFSACDNQLTSLQEGVFTDLHQLTTLTLAGNSISSIELGVFDESANLSSLSSIDLSNNALTELEPWPLVLAQHRRMTVQLQYNLITNFTNALRWNFDCRSKRIFGSKLDLSRNDIRHITDVLRGWNVDGEFGLLCLLNIDKGSPELDVDISYNPFECDCKDFNIISTSRLYGLSHALDRANCDQPVNLYQTKLVNVPLDELVCEVTELCPPGCSCLKRPSNRSFEVSCPPATLHNLPYRLPDPSQPPPRYGRYDLRFAGSGGLKFLESRDYFADTYRLDVSNSRIETVTDDAWRSLTKADRVDLSGNRLSTLPRLLQAENLTFRWIDLHGNPLSCECEQRWLPAWLRSLGGGLHQPDSVICRSPDWLDGKSVLSLKSGDFCRNPDRERFVYAMKIVVPTVAGAVLLVSLCFLVLYRYRVRVFAKFNLHPFDLDECDREDMAFDAFVSCAWPDDTLARAVVDRLERGNVDEGDRGGYRVCYHSRDFPLGGIILRSIQQSIERSKRVVCLLSEAFLSSEFCMLEFRTAWQWNLDHQRHRLIVVKCPGVDAALATAERDAVPGVEDVRMFLSTYTYIEHGSEDWWQKMLYAMPINRLPAVDFDFHQRFFSGDVYDDQEALLIPD